MGPTCPLDNSMSLTSNPPCSSKHKGPQPSQVNSHFPPGPSHFPYHGQTLVFAGPLMEHLICPPQATMHPCSQCPSLKRKAPPLPASTVLVKASMEMGMGSFIFSMVGLAVVGCRVVGQMRGWINVFSQNVKRLDGLSNDQSSTIHVSRVSNPTSWVLAGGLMP